MRSTFAAIGAILLAAAPLGAAPALTDTGTAGANADLPIRQVTLYTSGVGYFERAGAVDGDAAQTLLFPTGEINDVLKSLTLLDTGGGSIRPVTYAAQDPVSRQLQDFSVDLSDNPDRATLLNRLRGTSITVTTAQGATTGTVVGVETHTTTLPNSSGTTDHSDLNLMADDGLHTIALADVSSFKINDPAVNAELTQALSVVAQGRDAGKRAVTLNFSGQGRRSVSVGYLTEVPLWQTTYRLVLGKQPILQGWAQVQNTSPDNWDAVRLTLVSGQPISFIQDLYTPQYVPRPTVAPRIAASPTPQTYASDMDQPTAITAAPVLAPLAPPVQQSAAFGVGGGFGGVGGGMPGVAHGMTQYYGTEDQLEVNGPARFNIAAAAAQSMGTNGAKLGTALFSYAIKVPVSVPRGESAMIPFFSGAISAEPVAIYNPQVQPDHPLSGARLKNTSGLHLMGGPITVFDTGANGAGYVGDALIDDTEPGQTRLISYALDLAVDAHTDDESNGGHVTAIVIAQGVLNITRKEVSKTLYRLKNNGSVAQTIVIEQPYQGADWTLLEPKTATERTADTLRFDVPLPAGASVDFPVQEEHPTLQTLAITDNSDGNLLAFSQMNLASAAVRAALQEVIARRRAAADTQAKIDDTVGRIAAITQDQSRIRDNMRALAQSSALYKRYAAELDAQETQIETLQTQQNTLDAQLAQQKAALADYLAHLDVQ